MSCDQCCHGYFFPNDDEVQLLVSAMATKMAPSNESPLEQPQMESPFESQQV